MNINFCIRMENASVRDVLDTAMAVEDAGFEGVSFADQLMDLFYEGGWTHESWTMMSAAAALTERISVGSMVLNIANRDPGTLAVAAGTLQNLADGRAWIGLGLGGNADEIFARDQVALGRIPQAASERRAALRGYIAELRRVWAADHFISPAPPPPVFVGTFGRLGAQLAGAHADGIASALDGFGDHSPNAETLVALARDARAEAGLADDLRVVIHTGPEDDVLDEGWRAGSTVYDRIDAIGADRLVVFTEASPRAVAAAARRLPRPE